MTYDEARRYIGGEQFDAVEWERKHILRLRDSMERELLEADPRYFENLRKTCARYIENHQYTPNRDELKALMETYMKIVQAAERFRREDQASAGKQTDGHSKKVKRNRKTSLSR